MLGSLNAEQSKYILESNHIGRIGSYANGRVLVVPVTYVCDSGNIYGISLEGNKIQMMRSNPNVCFEVDCIDNLANWRSVIAWGKFEELKSGDSQNHVRKLFEERLSPLILGETVSSSREVADPPHRVIKKEKPVIYRIVLKEMTGRYEKR